ncbi:hypothetical protein [Pseudooctadecabacter sp.]|uniref:hypothetical protein n=1 Tax=Pseudooctadecabacter sp. TaxID=1966338 RepID=UPI00345A7DEE
MGGHVGVGLDNSLFISRGERAEINARRMANVRPILGRREHTEVAPKGCLEPQRH